MSTNHGNGKANRLANEKSPYLLQHAYNPVDWYPWSEEAFEKARTEGKPIFLSIGYSTCHWCHVMERESFEDQEVADLLNQHYVSIKVDREERPDVDHIYMEVCQAMTGHGGWPLTVVMTPDKKPFFTGTYFPKESKYGRPGLMDILTQLHSKWTEDQDRVVRTGQQIVDAIQEHHSKTKGKGELTKETLTQAYEQYESTFDPQYGGFGQAPKFPSPHNLSFLLRHWKLTKQTHALEMVEKTLDTMHRGGIYDHVGGGFSRYSTDEKWLVPHFEKMLYDNALLALVYLDTYQATGKEKYADVARQIFTYVLRDMTDPEGGFYSAEDADSEGEEGKFYVWRPEEVHAILGEEDGARFNRVYDITDYGNFEHSTSIPNLVEKSLEQSAQEEGMELDELKQFIEKCRVQLFEAREKRVHPHKDDKILTAWNGLMIAALARGAVVLGDEEYAKAAANAVHFIGNKLQREDGRLLARYRDGEAAFPGYLDDYAFLIWGLLELYEATFEADYLMYALELQEQQFALFWDKESGGFYFYGSDAEQLLTRPKELYDGAMPSGNSVAAMNLARLSRLTGNDDIVRLTSEQISAFAGDVALHPMAYSHFMMAVQFLFGPTQEVVIAAPNKQAAQEMVQEVRRHYMPNAVVSVVTNEAREKLLLLAPMLTDKTTKDGKATAYVCENFACQAPVTSLEELKQQLT
ncbi:thioredoxin domain-containing protein [Aneurinibacillus danicus]|uniref:Thioredoxin domain-containing protein n=1 Tax=Aneurinibacillus danicus TaxID=267746 RepID=A0A511VA36_9BACL|nr:thioredoxin domain-containing protein [Aneurinibacillus danicus]GEN35790.1 thioredoxin domain-containing protein [Aneurinibacillus danicus]